MAALYFKALHIVFIVTWFAGLFYIVRLFVYHAEAKDKPEPERGILIAQYKIMERRLWYGITWPSAIATLLLGASLLWSMPFYLKLGFMHVKLTFVALLYAYHFLCQRWFSAFQHDREAPTSQRLRVWNEVASLLLVAIVFVIVLKTAMSAVIGIAGLVGLGVVLMIAITLYRRRRLRAEAGAPRS